MMLFWGTGVGHACPNRHECPIRKSDFVPVLTSTRLRDAAAREDPSDRIPSHPTRCGQGLYLEYGIEPSMWSRFCLNRGSSSFFPPPIHGLISCSCGSPGLEQRARVPVSERTPPVVTALRSKVLFTNKIGRLSAACLRSTTRPAVGDVRGR